jgi:hypothetical protein
MIPDLAAVHEKQIKNLRVALMVYDVTVACLEPFIQPEMRDLMAGQIKAARDAYLSVTGEEPMVLGRRGG